MRRRVPLALLVLPVLVASAGCDRGAATPPAAQTDAPVVVAAPPTSTPSPSPAPAAAVDADPDPAPAVPAKPAVVAPDGTPALPCNQKSPADMACIDGGPFLRGADDGPENARPQSTVWVQTFYMDLREVTYAEYEACEKEKRCNDARPRYTDYDHPNMPMTGVSWFDAVKYCEAHGKRLPSEAQWEKAARGTEGALYPWGNDPISCERAIYRDASGRGCGLKKQFSKPETGRPWDVGSRPAGVYGLFDMVGNSWEWVDDWYSKSYAHCGAACEGVDPRGPCGGEPTCASTRNKIVRGGSWYWEDEKATGVYRRAHVPSNDPFHHFGFRCAATIEQAAALAPK